MKRKTPENANFLWKHSKYLEWIWMKWIWNEWYDMILMVVTVSFYSWYILKGITKVFFFLFWNYFSFLFSQKNNNNKFFLSFSIQNRNFEVQFNFQVSKSFVIFLFVFNCHNPKRKKINYNLLINSFLFFFSKFFQIASIFFLSKF